MRLLTKREKEFIRRFIDVTSTQRNINCVYVYAKLMGDKIGIDFVNGYLLYYTDAINFLPLTQAEQDLIDITLLLQYLDETGYLVFTKTDALGSINIKQGVLCEKKQLSDEVAYLIKNYADSKIYITSTMIELVKNDFKSLEEQMLDEAKQQTGEAKQQTDETIKQRRMSCITIALSVFSIIASVCLPVVCSNVHLDDKQFDDIRNNINAASDSIQKAIKEEKKILQITRDTCVSADSGENVKNNRDSIK